ncbi:MAG: VIT domain-containing protein [Sandaracinaceae bacterium]
MNERNQMNERQERFEAFLDDLAAIVDGDPAALERHADFLADDDEARDLRYEATQTAREMSVSGADFVLPADFEAKLLLALDREAGGAEPGRTTSPGFGVQSAGMQAAGVQSAGVHSSSGERPVASEASSSEASSSEASSSEATSSGAAADHRTGNAGSYDPAVYGVARPPSGVTPSPVVTHPTAAETAKPETKPSSSKRGVLLLFPILGAIGLAVAAAVGLAFFFLSDHAGGGEDEEPANVANAHGLSGSIEEIDRASSDGESGVTVRRPGSEEFVALGADHQVPAGSTVRTDDRTRARLRLSDGSEVVLNHATELALLPEAGRGMRLAGGDVVADIAHLDAGPNATFATPSGRIEVLGTKFELSATDDVTSVRVSRGVVSMSGNDGSNVAVNAGEEGLVNAGAAPSVAPVPDLAGSMAWSELGTVGGTDDLDTIAGIGSLRARRPGEREDRERPLNLASHQVRVRIVGNVARTEIEEVFRNESDTTLEGVYRFPLPADAQIARLALDVDGRMEEGSFVERDRAARIWRGVLRNATPRAQRDDSEEFIWVPGPWVDPAILEWQRGGQFELRIFPIPAHGERRVILGYTQTVQPQGAQRRYVYPLAHSADDSTHVGRFEVDVRVAGAERVNASGYSVTSANDDDATRLTFHEDDFTPKGDLTIDYQLPGGEREVRWWTYRGAAASAPAEDSREQDREVQNRQRELSNDARPYVVFALRPELPRTAQRRERDYVLVVDASQSMVGERFHRASRLATHVVSEMDRRDRFTVLACDYTCQQLPGGLRAPGAAASASAAEWLDAVEPAGASDIVASLREAAAMVSADRREGRELHVLYVGDGVSTAGYRRAASLGAEMRQLAEREHLAVSTVGIGGDADTSALLAMARSAGGHYVPYVPGQRTSVAAMAVLETTYGASLESPRVELPAGLSDSAPNQLPTVRAGQELLVVARMDRDNVSGPIRLTGQVAGRPFERSYDVSLTPTESAGNLFVPRLWAAGRIEDMQLAGRGEDTGSIIAMSKAFGVMSRHTSLLVLESEAMFRAFRVDRNTAPALQWTGEEDVVGGETGGLVAATANAAPGATRSQSGYGRAEADDGDAAFEGVGTIGRGAGGGGLAGGSAGQGQAAMPSSRARTSLADDTGADRFDREDRRNMELQRRAPAAEAAEAAPMAQPPPPVTATPPRRPGRWMRRVTVRVGEIQRGGEPTESERRQAEEAERRLRENPDSRDRHRDAVRRLARAGQLARALEVAESWVERDRLDPEALTAKADLLGRMGHRQEALRLLTGTVDLAPESAPLHTRLAGAFERAGQPERACAHRIALAEIDENDASAVAEAMRCERALSRDEAAQRILMSVREAQVRTRAERLLGEEARDRGFRGDFTIDADWSGGGDVDLSVITPDGTRLSWMGGRTTVVGEESNAAGRERLGLRWSGVGTYLIEVNRTDPTDARPIHGQLRLRVLGERQTVPFSLESERAEVARVRVSRQTRLEAVTGTVGF